MSKTAKIIIELVYGKEHAEARDLDFDEMTDSEFEEYVYDNATEDLHYLLREESLVHWSELIIEDSDEKK